MGERNWQGRAAKEAKAKRDSLFKNKKGHSTDTPLCNRSVSEQLTADLIEGRVNKRPIKSIEDVLREQEQPQATPSTSHTSHKDLLGRLIATPTSSEVSRYLQEQRARRTT